MANSGKKVENFSPDLLRLFAAGQQRTVRLKFRTRAEGYAFVYRMNKLRQAMRTEQHHMLSIAEGVQVAYVDKEEFIVEVKPSDDRFLDVVREALGAVEGLNLPELTDPPLDWDKLQTPEVKASRKALEDFLNQPIAEGEDDDD